MEAYSYPRRLSATTRSTPPSPLLNRKALCQNLILRSTLADIDNHTPPFSTVCPTWSALRWRDGAARVWCAAEQPPSPTTGVVLDVSHGQQQGPRTRRPPTARTPDIVANVRGIGEASKEWVPGRILALQPLVERTGDSIACSVVATAIKSEGAWRRAATW